MSPDFQTSLQAGDLDGVRRCAKSDLHNHFVLGGERNFLAQRTGRHIAQLDRRLTSMAEMHAWVQAVVGELFDNRDGRSLGFEAALVQARKDGVSRLEIGEDVWAITLYNSSAYELTRSLQQLHARVAPEIEWIPQLGLSRNHPPATLERRLSPFLELEFYQTLDLYGDEFAQPIGAFKSLFRQAKDAGLRVKAHVGEWGTADDVWRAVEELELDEVQHGIAAAASPAVMRFLANNQIRLNICPTSNVMLGRVENLAAHPIRDLYDAGVRVTVNTDDVLIFGQGVSEEFLDLYRAGALGAAELDNIRANGLGQLDPAEHPSDR